MWYVRILWPLIYILRPSWEKSVEKWGRSDVIITVTPSPAKNIETKRKKLHFSFFFSQNLPYVFTVILNYDTIPFHNDMRKDLRKKCAKSSFFLFILIKTLWRHSHANYRPILIKILLFNRNCPKKHNSKLKLRKKYVCATHWSQKVVFSSLF